MLVFGLRVLVTVAFFNKLAFDFILVQVHLFIEFSTLQIFFEVANLFHLLFDLVARLLHLVYFVRVLDLAVFNQGPKEITVQLYFFEFLLKFHLKLLFCLDSLRILKSLLE